MNAPFELIANLTPLDVSNILKKVVGEGMPKHYVTNVSFTQDGGAVVTLKPLNDER